MWRQRRYAPCPWQSFLNFWIFFDSRNVQAPVGYAGSRRVLAYPRERILSSCHAAGCRHCYQLLLRDNWRYRYRLTTRRFNIGTSGRRCDRSYSLTTNCGLDRSCFNSCQLSKSGRHVASEYKPTKNLFAAKDQFTKRAIMLADEKKYLQFFFFLGQRNIIIIILYKRQYKFFFRVPNIISSCLCFDNISQISVRFVVEENEMLSAFGERVKAQRVFLSRKTDCSVSTDFSSILLEI